MLLNHFCRLFTKSLKLNFFKFSSEVVPTWSPAMDILVPYNVERILTLASNFDFPIVDLIMKQFEVNPKVGTKIPEELLQIVKKTIVGRIIVSNLFEHKINDNNFLLLVEIGYFMKQIWYLQMLS